MFTIITPSLFRSLIVSALAYCMVACVNDNLESLAKRSSSSTQSSTAAADSAAASTSSSSSSSASSASPGSSSNGAATVSFTADVRPILLKYQCASCHGSFYTSYNGVSNLARSGQLYGTMSWASGYRRMPPGQKPTTAELALITTWVNAGEPNN